jgi:hypothetical protein
MYSARISEVAAPMGKLLIRDLYRSYVAEWTCLGSVLRCCILVCGLEEHALGQEPLSLVLLDMRDEPANAHHGVGEDISWRPVTVEWDEAVRDCRPEAETPSGASLGSRRAQPCLGATDRAELGTEEVILL